MRSKQKTIKLPEALRCKSKQVIYIKWSQLVIRLAKCNKLMVS